MKSLFAAVKIRMSPVIAWFMAPVFLVKRARRNVVVALLRSRFFFLVAIASGASELGGAISSTWKFLHPSAGAGYWLPLTVCVLAWIYYASVLFMGVTEAIAKFTRRKRIRALREKRRSGIR